MKILKNKMLCITLLIYFIGIIFGIISFFLIDNNIINESIDVYFNSYSSSFNYLSGLLNTNVYNLCFSFFIWVSGFFIIGIIIAPLLIFLKAFSLGITLISIIVQFKLKGVLLAFILFLSNVLLFDLIFMFLSYYSINLSLKTFNIIKNNKSINIRLFYKNYIFRYLIFIFTLFLTSLFDIYVLSNLIKYIII